MSDSRPSQTSIARRDGSRPGPRRWFAVAACAALLLTASTGAATAASGARGNVHVPYLGQTERAGLTQAQAAALQRKIDRYMAQLGGTQVSANRIDWADGHMVVAVPGERLEGFELLGRLLGAVQLRRVPRDTGRLEQRWLMVEQPNAGHPGADVQQELHACVHDSAGRRLLVRPDR